MTVSFIFNTYQFLVPGTAAILLLLYRCHFRSKHVNFKSSSQVNHAPHLSTTQKRNEGSSKSEKFYRNLFFQLQNIEDFPDALEIGRDELLAMLSRGIVHGMKRRYGNITLKQEYHPDEVRSFIESEQERVMTGWTRYLEKRKQGHGPQLFSSVETARSWLMQQAPVKLVDGAWLSHVHKISTPFALRGITKDAWQVFSEELGDGDLFKHHVYLYRQLLADVGCQLPESYSADFIKAYHWNDMQNESVWEAAAGQLLISLFPNEFLPEILGFNMHFELVTIKTMCAAYELKALGIDPSYFLIHIAIDNADSGHVAMATNTVIRYLETERIKNGVDAVSIVWQRVKAGYMMSQALESRATDVQNLPELLVREPSDPPLNTLTAKMINIFKAKALVSHKCHHQSQARIGGRYLSEWLAPVHWKHSDSLKHVALLGELSRAKPWVFAGASDKSILVRELQWGGRMFGAFTHDEVSILKKWIDSLGSENHGDFYWSFTGRSCLESKDAILNLQHPILHYPAIPIKATCEMLPQASPQISNEMSPEEWKELPLYKLSSQVRKPDLMLLWFTHIGLLENTVVTPSLTTSPLYLGILRLLRAQSGFAVEKDVVAGMDEMNRPSYLSLVDIGLEMVSCMDTSSSVQVECLDDVFILANNQGRNEETSILARDMMHWAQQPKKYLGWLLGSALAFLPMKDLVTRSAELLSSDSRLVLGDIVK